jgi:hypothetical protein
MNMQLPEARTRITLVYAYKPTSLHTQTYTHSNTHTPAKSHVYAQMGRTGPQLRAQPSCDGSSIELCVITGTCGTGQSLPRVKPIRIYTAAQLQ